MNRIDMTVAGRQVTVLVPDGLQNEQKMQALWLLAPEGEEAAVWLANTKAEEYAQTAKAILVCVPWDEQDGFYSQSLWTALHEKFPTLSEEPKGHRLLGLWDSAVRCLNLVFRYPERFCIVVAVCPETRDEGKDLLTAVKEYMASGKPRPRTVISDCPQGQGKTLGDAINAYGVDMHVHGERTLSGWDLMDAEIKSCLAHL